MNWLSEFPDERNLLELYPQFKIMNTNAHVHTPFSFSAFTDIEQIFDLVRHEGIAAIGINDFFVTDGFRPFYEEAMKSGTFPMFNAEFIGLLKKQQQSGIRINDPANPGRCYFCGKGLDYPFHVTAEHEALLEKVINLSQQQIVKMILKVNKLFKDLNVGIILDFEQIKSRYAKNLVRERHIAKAIRIAVFERFADDPLKIAFLTRLFGGKPLKSYIMNIPGVENEIRSNLLKSGGSAFVEEDDETFLPIDVIIKIITDAGGIPCYPVLLDDKDGNYTEFESSPEILINTLTTWNVLCVEFIPGRNNAAELERYAEKFSSEGFVVLMGTEHNSPDMIPLTCNTRGKIPLTEKMRTIAYEGACVVAAHEYFRSKGLPGYRGKFEKDHYIRLGNALIHYQNKKTDKP
jgi:hypothetical protein